MMCYDSYGLIFNYDRMPFSPVYNVLMAQF